jgi:hypothetical protein
MQSNLQRRADPHIQASPVGQSAEYSGRIYTLVAWQQNKHQTPETPRAEDILSKHVAYVVTHSTHCSQNKTLPIMVIEE